MCKLRAITEVRELRMIDITEIVQASERCVVKGIFLIHHIRRY